MNYPSINRFILPSPVSPLFFFLYVPLRSSLPLLSIPLRTLDISRFPCRHVPRRGQAMSLSHVSFTPHSHMPSSGAVMNVTFPAFSPVLMFMLSKMSPFFFSSNESGMYFFFNFVNVLAFKSKYLFRSPSLLSSLVVIPPDTSHRDLLYTIFFS